MDAPPRQMEQCKPPELRPREVVAIRASEREGPCGVGVGGGRPASRPAVTSIAFDRWDSGEDGLLISG